VFILFCVAACAQFFYYFYFYSQLFFYKKKKEEIPPVPVSIVICARNEANNLKKYLPGILEQDYPDFEVVVVNDCSEDETEYVLLNFSKQYPHLRTTFLKEDQKFSHGKKLALTVGLKSAKNEWVLLTDADCYPTSNKWLANMADHFTEKKSVVIGYGGYIEKHGLLNSMIRYDTAFIALQYFSFALAGLPYMGVGRNLGYRRSLFFSNRGFASHSELESGDDDLFVNQVATVDNTAIEFRFGAHTRSKAENKFSSWSRQKRRHLTTGRIYKSKHKLLLCGEQLSRVMFYLFFIALLFFPLYNKIAITLFVFRIFVYLFVIYFNFKRLDEKKLFIPSLFYDFVLPYLYFWLFVTTKYRSLKRWR